MLYVAANLTALVGFVGIFYVSGWMVDRPGVPRSGRLPTVGLYRFGVGAALWMGIAFLLAAVRLLRPLAIAAVLVVVCGLALLRRVAGDQRESLPHPSAALRQRWTAGMLAVGVASLLMALWLQNQWPAIAWDADAYHLTVPRLFLEHGGFYRIPFNVYSNWPLNTQLLYGLALTARGFIGAKQMHFLFGAATLLLVYRVVASRERAWIGWLAAALFLLNPVVLDEIRVAYVDLAYSFFLLLAFLFIHQALEEPELSDSLLLRAGLLGGVAAGTKPTAVLGVLCLAVVYLVAARRREPGPARLLTDLLRLTMPVGLLLLPWAIKSWILTGNPAYPFLYDLFGGPEWSAELGRKLHQWQRSIGMGRDLVDYLLLPVRVILYGERGYETFDGRILRLWVVLIPFAVVFGRRSRLALRCLAAAGLYFLTWALTSQQMRFLIPALPFLAIATAMSVGEGIRSLPTDGRRRAEWATVAAVLAMVGWTASRLLPQTLEMTGEYRRRGVGIEALAVEPVYRFIDAELPADAKLMFLNTNHGFFCAREFIADSFFEASQLQALLEQAADAAAIDATMAELGITHLLIENRDRYVEWPRSLFDYLNDTGRVRRLYRSPDRAFDVVELVSATAIR